MRDAEQMHEVGFWSAAFGPPRHRARRLRIDKARSVMKLLEDPGVTEKLTARSKVTHGSADSRRDGRTNCPLSLSVAMRVPIRKLFSNWHFVSPTETEMRSLWLQDLAARGIIGGDPFLSAMHITD